jgi:hypothetical protein
MVVSAVFYGELCTSPTAAGGMRGLHTGDTVLYKVQYRDLFVCMQCCTPPEAMRFFSTVKCHSIIRGRQAKNPHKKDQSCVKPQLFISPTFVDFDMCCNSF